VKGLQVRAFAGRQERCGKTVRRAGKACLIAKGSRIPADWARHPWLAHFALQAGLTCPAGGSAFCYGKGKLVLTMMIKRLTGLKLLPRRQVVNFFSICVKQCHCRTEEQACDQIGYQRIIVVRHARKRRQ